MAYINIYYKKVYVKKLYSVDYNTKTCDNLKLGKTPSLIREC